MPQNSWRLFIMLTSFVACKAQNEQSKLALAGESNTLGKCSRRLGSYNFKEPQQVYFGRQRLSIRTCYPPVYRCPFMQGMCKVKGVDLPVHRNSSGGTSPLAAMRTFSTTFRPTDICPLPARKAPLYHITCPAQHYLSCSTSHWTWTNPIQPLRQHDD